MVSAFLLIDIRHELQPIDLVLRWLGEHFIPFSIVFTNDDKIKREIETKVSDYLEVLKVGKPSAYIL